MRGGESWEFFWWSTDVDFCFSSFFQDANRGCGVGHLYLAIGGASLGITADSAGHDDLETQERVTLSSEELQTAILQGSFKVRFVLFHGVLFLQLLSSRSSLSSPFAYV